MKTGKAAKGKRQKQNRILLLPYAFCLRFSSNLTLGPACGLLLAQLSPAALFTWFLIVLASAKLFLHSAAFNEFLEAAECHPNRFFVMHPHS